MNQTYLFIIWGNGRKKENYILEKIKNDFVIRDIFEIQWTEKNFSNNMKRFYGPKLGNVKTKVADCGISPFLLIIVSDPHPRFDKRRTSNGMELVNINLFDKKKLYRKLTRIGYAIHSSITEKETNDDLTLMLGKNLKDFESGLSEKWDGNFKKINCDLVGQDNWKNIDQLFYVLNSTTNYVVLRNFEELNENFQSYNHNDVDILTDNFLQIPFIANGGKSSFNNEFSSSVKIGDSKIKFDFGYPGDNYLDEKWATDILKRRILYHGLYVPSKEDHFYSLFYHAVFHQQNISQEYRKKLTELASELKEITFKNNIFDDIDESKKFIESYMSSRGYLHTNSIKYRFIHNSIFRLAKVSLLLWRVHGINFLFTAIKNKIKRILKI